MTAEPHADAREWCRRCAEIDLDSIYVNANDESHVRAVVNRMQARLDAARAAPQADAGTLREVQSNWPEHYSPDQAKAWIAAVDAVDAALAASSPATDLVLVRRDSGGVQRAEARGRGDAEPV